jgi:hypothetical protein
MKIIASVALTLCTAATVVAQVPRVPVPRNLPLPRIDQWTRGEPPLTTSLKDARVEVPWLDRLAPRFADMASLRNTRGTFTLRTGHWAMDLQSFCLHPGTRGPQPADGRGYLPGPMRGPQAGIIIQMLEGYGRMPDITQHDLQTLFWAILSKTRIRSMSITHQRLAARLLTPAQLVALETGALDVIPVSMRRRIFGALPADVRRIAEAENRLRDTLTRANSSYAALTRAAVLAGPLPSSGRQIPRERWSVHSGGYLIRYSPKGFARTTVEIAVPTKYEIRRDSLGRIVSVDFGDGRRTESEYDDSIPPFRPPGANRAVAYAFKSVRLIRPGGSGAPEEVVVRGKGWTFVVAPDLRAVRPPAGRFQVTLASTLVFRSAALQPGSRMERFERWKERYDTWNEEFKERADWYRERAEHATDPPPDVEQTRRDLEDLEHYRDGIEAALSGDTGERLDWIIDNQERMNAALERATIVLSGLPAHPEDDYSPVPDMAIPGGGQRLGLSSRGY